MDISKLNHVTYNDFKMNTTIDPEQFDTNFSEVVAKIDSIIDYINSLDDVTVGASGASKIGSEPIIGVQGTTLQTQIASLRQVLDQYVLGQVPDDSLTNAKISPLSKIGLLADLTTIDKTSIVSALNEIRNELTNTTINTPAMGFGASSVKYTGKASVIPEVNFNGMAIINLLGKNGDCEDVSKWLAYLSTITQDTNNKVFGQASIKVTGNAGNCAVNITSVLDASKYYMLSGYVKNGNLGGGLALAVEMQGIRMVSSPAVTDTTKFVRTGVKVQPSDFTGGAAAFFVEAYIVAGASAGQYANIDGLMFNEISASDYANLTIDQLLVKYPYVESYGALTNPYFENRRFNLVRNGNCEEGVSHYVPYNTTVSIAVSNGKFKVTTAGGGAIGVATTPIKVKANTNYYLSGNITAGTCSGQIYVVKAGFTGNLRVGTGAFNTGDCTEVFVYLNNTADNAYCYFDSVMLIEGTVAPSAYKSCDIQRFVVEGQFTQDDNVTLKDGKVSGQLMWKHRTMFGKDYDWQLAADATGHKVILSPVSSGYSKAIGDSIGVKYDGRVTPNIAQYSTDTDGITLDNNPNNNAAYAKILDTDSGWAESINPNNDEVKAFMNGWNAFGVSLSSRYVIWRAIGNPNYSVDIGAYPKGFATTLNAVTTGNNQIQVADASIAEVNDYIAVIGVTNPMQVTAKNGSTFTLSGVVAAGVNNICVVRCDNGTSDTRYVTYCKNNVAPGYEGYRIHYKLANPEPITDVNVHVHGSIWDIVPGDNYIDIEAGMVLGEVANPVTPGDGYYHVGINNTANQANSPFKNIEQANSIVVYKNGNYDLNKWTTVGYGTSPSDVNGWIFIPVASFDVNAVYTVDYQMLKTLNAQSFSSFVIRFAQGVYDTLTTLAKEVETKQERDSALDTLVDLSMYEEIFWPQWTRACVMPSSQARLPIRLPFLVRKKCVPIVTVKSVAINARDNSGGISVVNQADIKLTVIPDINGVQIYLDILNTTQAAYALNNGAAFSFKVIADCRGRI